MKKKVLSGAFFFILFYFLAINLAAHGAKEAFNTKLESQVHLEPAYRDMLNVKELINPSEYTGTPCIAVDLKCEYLTNPIAIDIKKPRLSWRLKDDRRGACQTAYQILVSTDSLFLSSGGFYVWRTKEIKSNKTNDIIYDGKPLHSFTKYYWKVIVWDKDRKKSVPSAIGTWETAFIGGLKEWKGAWIGDGKDTSFKPAPYFRKEFTLNGKIKKARAYICGLGYFEFYLNGKKVGNDMLSPAYTRYDKTDYYMVYDVTSLLQEKDNVAGIILGNGWYNEQSYAVWNFHKAPWRKRPKLLLNLYIEYENGKTDVIVSDTSWRVSTGPIIFNNIYSGEYYDANLEMPGWDSTEFDDSHWKKAVMVNPPAGRLKAQLMPPIRPIEDLKAVSMKKFSDTLYVFDMGQNFAGLSRLRVKGEKGTIIQLKHGEALYPNGLIDNRKISVHYRFADTTEKAQTDRYILKGGGTEEFMQHFTYHGYRFIEAIASKPITLNKNSVEGIVIHADLKRIGNFSCSNPLINKIYKAGIWTYLSNIQSIPTDCPQREKNGWTADGHVATELGLYNFDGILFYEKWIGDFVDEQRQSGELPGIIPTSGWGYHWGNGPAWDSALLLIPWYIYEYYGDDNLIKKYYDNYKKYVDYLTFRADDNILHIGLGDWSPYKTRTPAEFTSTCYYYVDANLLSKYARMNSKDDDAKYYSALANRIKNTINNRLFDKDKFIYSNGSQTALSAALFQSVVPDELKAKVAENLADEVHKNNDHLDVGLLGSKYLLNALSDNGYTKLAYKVASQKTRPSWGWWLLNGETTFQESWEIGPSRNHIMFGEIVAWLFKDLAGIKVDSAHPSFRNIIIKPGFNTGLTHVKASTKCVNGTIISEWSKKNNNISLTITIPANSTATVYLPVISAEKVYESGLLVKSSKYIKFSGRKRNNFIYQVAAGKYYFEIKR